MNTDDVRSTPPEDREVVDLGPIRIERVGRVLYMRSNLDADSHAQQMERWRDHRPDFKKSIDDEIQRLRELLTANNPLSVLGHIASVNLFGNPEEYRETTHEGSEASVELAMSLATSLPFPEAASTPAQDAVSECIQLSRQILDDCFWYYGTEVAEKGDKGVETEIRQLLLGKALQVRGDAYWPHIRQTFLEIYSPLASELSKLVGFTPDQFLDTLEWAENEINGRIISDFSKAKVAYDKAKESHGLFKQWSEGKNSLFGTVDEMMTAFAKEYPHVKEDVGRLYDVLSQVIGEDSFAVVPRNEVDKKVLDSVSTEFGENAGFWEYLSDSRGWPLNDSVIHKKPVIRHSGKYFLFHTPLALRSITKLLALVVIDKADKQFETRLLHRRDDYLEDKGVDLLTVILQGCKTYTNVFYPNDSGQGWLETDGLIVYGDTLLIVEAKAGRLSPSAWRGGFRSFNRGVRDIVGVAHQQGLSVLKYLNGRDIAQFYNERRQPVVALRRTDFVGVFVINVTLEQLGMVATHISWISDLGIIRGKEWPWVVNLNDLRVISEVVEHPTEFIHYLMRRLRANDFVQLQLFDELSFFMLYLKEGLHWKGGKLDQNIMITMMGYTEELDSYYLYKEGKRSPVLKPRQPIPEGLNSLITALEIGQAKGFVRACLALYDRDDVDRTKISENISRIDSECASQGRPKSISLVFNESQTSLLIGASPAHSYAWVKNWADRHSSKHGARTIVAITWEPPISKDSVRVDLFDY